MNQTAKAQDNSKPPAFFQESFNTCSLPISLTIILAWGLCVTYSMSRLSPEESSLFFSLSAILLLTHLYTGLFIVAHDAMHGLVAPQSPVVNRLVGAFCVRAYAMFSYRILLEKHKEHHDHSGLSDDPDFAATRNPCIWYLKFICTYLTLPQMIWMASIHFCLSQIFSVPHLSLLLFWIAPMLLSTLQLFYFGTYLPHVRLEQEFCDKHNARSLSLNALFSLLSCYNFGACHLQHHRYPWVPWWALQHVKVKESQIEIE